MVVGKILIFSCDKNVFVGSQRLMTGGTTLFVHNDVKRRISDKMLIDQLLNRWVMSSTFLLSFHYVTVHINLKYSRPFIITSTYSFLILFIILCSRR